MKNVRYRCLIGLLTGALAGGCVETEQEAWVRRTAETSMNAHALVDGLYYVKDPRGPNLCYAAYAKPGQYNFAFSSVDCEKIPAELLMRPQSVRRP